MSRAMLMRMMMEKAANDMDGDTMGNHDADDDDGNNIPLLHDDEQLTGFKTAIFNIGYKKVRMRCLVD
jgi:hypothetical protein